METQELVSNINQEPARLPGFFELLRESLKIIKERFWIYLGIVVISMIGFLISYFLLIPLFLGLMIVSSVSNLGWLSFIIMLLLLSLIGMFFGIWPVLAVFYVTKERDRNVGIFEALKKTFFKVLPAFWISLLVNLAIATGLLLLIIPGFIFFKWFCLSVPVLLSENVRGFKALSRSKELVKGKTILTKLAGLIIISGLVSFIIDPLLKSDSIIKILVASLISILSMLVCNVLIFLIYEKLRKMERRDYKEERIGGEVYQEVQTGGSGVEV